MTVYRTSRQGWQSVPLLFSVAIVILLFAWCVPSASAQAGGGGQYYVCTFNYYKTVYLSDVSGPYQTSDIYNKLVTEFTAFVRTKYSLAAGAGLPMCIYKFSASDAQAAVKQLSKTSSDTMVVLTGWKDGETATPAPAPSAAPSQPAAASPTVAPSGVYVTPGGCRARASGASTSGECDRRDASGRFR